MSLKAGIVGLPNVGKSTLFNAITKQNILAANYPFATIEPNVGIVLVPDSRVDYLANMYKPKSVVPTTFEFTDIAGLVKGASQGEGLGNKFLSHIREVDAIVEVVRCFDDANVTHVTGKTDPVGDIEIKAIATPGHTPGGMSYLIGDKLFSGDTLFHRSIGRCDFPGGSLDTIIKSIKEKLFTLPDNTEVFPGHGEKTTIAYEKKYNEILNL